MPENGNLKGKIPSGMIANGTVVQCAHCFNKFPVQDARFNPMALWNSYDCPLCNKTSRLRLESGSEPIQVPDTL